MKLVPIVLLSLLSVSTAFLVGAPKVAPRTLLRTRKFIVVSEEVAEEEELDVCADLDGLSKLGCEVKQTIMNAIEGNQAAVEAVTSALADEEPVAEEAAADEEAADEAGEEAAEEGASVVGPADGMQAIADEMAAVPMDADPFDAAETAGAEDAGDAPAAEVGDADEDEAVPMDEDAALQPAAQEDQGAAEDATAQDAHAASILFGGEANELYDAD